MNITKILCPIDFSDFNQAANELASALAQIWKASIVYLAVPDQNSGDYEFSMQRAADKELEKLKQFEPTQPGITCHYDVKISSVTANTIVEYAEQHEIDLIVMATHGRTGLRRIFMGSVAEVVVRKASCPVLTLKPDNKKLAAPSIEIANTESESTKS